MLLECAEFMHMHMCKFIEVHEICAGFCFCFFREWWVNALNLT